MGKGKERGGEGRGWSIRKNGLMHIIHHLNSNVKRGREEKERARAVRMEDVSK